MSTPEIDRVTAESMEEDSDIGGEHTESTVRDQKPSPTSASTKDEGGSDSGGMAPG
jgi:hypothetical protein